MCPHGHIDLATDMISGSAYGATRVLALIALIFVLAGCGGPGVTGPCVNEDQDPTGICANSHSETD